jgi:hypothetical protein
MQRAETMRRYRLGLRKVAKNTCETISSMLGGVPVPTARRVLRLRMKERPAAMEVSCEYIE